MEQTLGINEGCSKEVKQVTVLQFFISLMKKDDDKKNQKTVVELLFSDEASLNIDRTLIYSMEALNVSRKRIREVPRDLELFKNLTSLNLSSNRIKNFDGEYVLTAVPLVAKLNLSHNEISNITCIYPLAHCQNLSELDVSNNRIPIAENRVALVQHLLFLPNFKPRVNTSLEEKKPLFITALSQKPRFMLETQSSQRRLSLSPTSARGESGCSSPTTLHQNQSLLKLRASNLSPSQKKFQRRGSEVLEQAVKNRRKMNDNFYDEDDEEDSGRIPPKTPEPDMTEVDSLLKEEKKKRLPASAGTETILNMYPFSQSVRVLQQQRSSQGKQKGSFPVPRDPKTPFFKLKTLNGLAITLEEYLFAENEEVFDIVTGAAEERQVEVTSDEEEEEEQDIEYIKKPSEPKLDYATFGGGEHNLRVDLLRYEFKKNRSSIDSILGVKRKTGIDFRPFKIEKAKEQPSEDTSHTDVIPAEVGNPKSMKFKRRQMAMNKETITLDGVDFRFHSLFV